MAPWAERTSVFIGPRNIDEAEDIQEVPARTTVTDREIEWRRGLVDRR